MGNQPLPFGAAAGKTSPRPFGVTAGKTSLRPFGATAGKTASRSRRTTSETDSPCILRRLLRKKSLDLGY